MEKIIKRLLEGLLNLIARVDDDTIVVIIADKRDLHIVMEILKNHTGLECEYLIDICGVDKGDSILMVYELFSLNKGMRVRVKCELFTEEVDSVVRLWKSASWLEREVYDMLGVNFIGHPDLRRLLTDYGFRGKPLRKEYVGIKEITYDEAQKVVVRKDEK